MYESLQQPETTQWKPPVRSWQAFALLAAFYVAAAMLVNPAGEFPLNDDWSYTRSAFRWGLEGRMVVDEWSAPSLIGQALYGGWLVGLAGPSFLAIRLSTLFLSWTSACLLWASCRRLGASTTLTAALVLALAANPIALSLSFTFMTEIPFLFFITLSFYAWIRHHEGGLDRWLVLCGIAAGYAYLIRQTAALFVLAFAIVLLAGMLRGARARGLRRLAALLAGSAPFVAGFAAWSRTQGATPAALRKFELLRELTFEQVFGSAMGALFYLAFFLLPLALLLIPRLLRLARSVRLGFILPASLLWSALAATGFFWFHLQYAHGPYLPAAAYHRQMPYLLNIIYDTGIGPLTLDPTYYGPPPTPTYPRIWFAITVATAAALVILGLAISMETHLFIRSSESPPRFDSLAAAGLASVFTLLFEIIFSHLQEGGLFDRHLLSTLLPLLWAIAALHGHASPRSKTGHPRKAACIVPFLAATAMTVFAVAGTHDYLEWNRARWDLGNRLLAAGTDPLLVSGGFEFNAWHNYDRFRERGGIEKVFHWWYDSPDYVIAMEPQEGYRILQRIEWNSWLHRRALPVLVLKKIQER